MHSEPDRRRRRPRQALLLAAAAVYLPTLTPFVTVDMLSSTHTWTTYLQLLPLVPVWLIAFAFAHGSSIWILHLVAAPFAAGLLALAYWIARRHRRFDALAGLLPIALLVAVASHALGAALRA